MRRSTCRWATSLTRPATTVKALALGCGTFLILLLALDIGLVAAPLVVATHHGGPIPANSLLGTGTPIFVFGGPLLVATGVTIGILRAVHRPRPEQQAMPTRRVKLLLVVTLATLLAAAFLSAGSRFRNANGGWSTCHGILVGDRCIGLRSLVPCCLSGLRVSSNPEGHAFRRHTTAAQASISVEDAAAEGTRDALVWNPR